MVAHPVLIAVITIVALGSFLAASLYPIQNEYNVKVTVGTTELSLLVTTYFQVTGISGVTTGQSTLLNWGGYGLGFAPPVLDAIYTLTVCVGGQCGSIHGNQFAPSVPLVNGATYSASNVVFVGYVPGGEQPITVALSQNGQQVASGSGTMCVGGGC